MKILLVQDHLRSGGTERQTLLLSRAFAAAGHATTLLTFRPGGALASTLDASVTHQVLQPFDTGLDWFAPGLNRAAIQLAPDITLCMGRMANCYAGGLQRHLPRSVVFSTMRTGKTLPWLFRRSLRETRHIVANSQEAKQNLIAAHPVPSEKISVIYNSLVFPPASSGASGVIPPAAEATRAAQGAGRATTVLLCVAMFRLEKNQKELIEIAAGLPADLDWQLWFAGDGPARVQCERLATEKKLAARIKFLGWQRDPGPLYAAANVAVHASRSESLSNFIIEAQAAGLPAVVYDAQGISECVLPGDTGFVIPPNDRASFQARLVALARESDDARQGRRTRAAAHARLTFDPQRQVAAYLELFQKLSASSAP
jgi:glycosyltransferase involved in cell wall biosynthesis